MELSDFEVEGLIATGGMGRVLAAVHLPSGLPVALKVLVGAHDTAAAIRREVRAVAGLDHRHIVPILDQGEIADGPYLVMTRAAGTLRHRRPGTWSRLRQVLREILSGLAHAHARGVLHRDLKASNVLVESDGRTLLADFGVSTALGREDHTICGTAGAMAPEQIRGAWRDYGPWTDLFAVGCLAYEIASGRTPYLAANAQIALEQMARGPERFHPRFPVPEGLWGWVERLLRVDPQERFRQAADASHALEELGEPVQTTVVREGSWSAAVETSASFFDAHQVAEPALERQRSAPDPARTALPPLPQTWRRPLSKPTPRIAGAGLRLFGLRSMPEVGRSREREVLWRALADIDSGPRCVVLSGPAGTGKTHLASWLLERAHEVGAALTLTCSNTRATGALDGPVAMTIGALRLEGLGLRERRTRLRAEMPGLDGPDRERLLRVMAPASRVTSAMLTSAIAAFVVGLARVRPVVLHLDDLQWGPDAAALARRLLETGAAVLIVATVRDDVQAREPADLEALRGTATVLDIAALDDDETSDLVSSLVALSPRVVEQVVQRTGGHPLFVEQLIGDWVDRGILIASEAGICLREGADVALPDALYDLWVDRLRDLSDGDREALEVAAALGDTVDDAVWHDALARAGLRVSAPAVDELERRRLVSRTAVGFSFVHGMLSEGLVRLARDEGRWPAWADAAGRAALEAGADLAAERGQPLAALPLLRRAEALMGETRGPDWIRACHYLGAAQGLRGRHDDAVTWCETALRAARQSGDTRAESLALGELGGLHTSSEPSLAVEHLEAALDLALECGDDVVAGRALTKLSYALTPLRRLDEAKDAAQAALEIHRRQGNRRSEAVALARLGRLHQLRDELDAAEAAHGAALRIQDEIGNLNLQGANLQNLGIIAIQRGQLRKAQAFLERALAVQREAGALDSEAVALSSMAGLYHELGRVAEAEVAYRSAIAVAADIGAVGVEVLAVRNLALLQREAGDLQTPLPALLDAQRRVQAVGDRWRLGVVTIELAALRLERGELDAADRAATEAFEALGDHPRATELGLLLSVQAEVAARRSQWTRAAGLLADAEKRTQSAGLTNVTAELGCARARIACLGGEHAAARADIAAVEALYAALGGPPARIAAQLAKVTAVLS